MRAVILAVFLLLSTGVRSDDLGIRLTSFREVNNPQLDLFGAASVERGPRFKVPGEGDFPREYGVFCRLNGTWLHFSPTKGNVWHLDPRVERENAAHAELPRALLKLKDNELFCDFRVGRAPSSTRQAPALTLADFELVFHVNEPGQHGLIFPAPRFAEEEFARVGDPPESLYRWRGTLKLENLTLKEIAPLYVGVLRWYQDRITALKKELDEIKKQEPSTEVLESNLKHLGELSLENIDPAEIEKVSPELNFIADNVRSLKNDIQKVKDQIQERIIQTNQDIAGLETRFIRPGDEERKKELQSLYASYNTQEFTLPTSVIPELILGENLYNDAQNTYQDIAETTLKRMRSAIERREREEFNVLVDAWATTQKALADTHLTASGQIGTREQKAFEAARVEVAKYIDSQVDEFGFFRDAAIASDVKEAIRTAWFEADPARARKMRDALNNFPAEQELTPEQKQIMKLVKAVAAAFKALRHTVDNVQQAATKIAAIADQTLEMARQTVRLGVAFTPLNDALDFCEVTLGIEGCMPGGKELTASERVVTATGLFIGSGTFWRGLAKHLPGGILYKTGDETAKIIEIIYKKHGELPEKFDDLILAELKEIARHDPSILEHVITARKFPKQAGKLGTTKSVLHLDSTDNSWGKAFAPGRWFDHFAKHKEEFSVKSPGEYLNLAKKFIQSGSYDYRIVRDYDRAILLANIKTTEIAIIDSDGLIASFYLGKREAYVKNFANRWKTSTPPK